MMGRMLLDFIIWLQSFQNQWTDIFFIAVTMLGEAAFYITILSLTYWCIDTSKSTYLVFILSLSVALNGALKEVFNQIRPIGVDEIRSIYTETATGKSFPSGHTQTATSFFVGLMVLFRKKIVWLFSGLAIVLVAISRLYLGVHWPADVIGGIGFGILASILAHLIVKKFDPKEVFWPYGVLVGIGFTGLIFFDSEVYTQALGVLSGYIIGSYIENRYVRFTVNAPLKIQVYKYLLGLIMTGILFVGMKYSLPDSSLADGLRYFATLVFVIAGAPAIFIKLNWSKRMEN